MLWCIPFRIGKFSCLSKLLSKIELIYNVLRWQDPSETKKGKNKILHLEKFAANLICRLAGRKGCKVFCKCNTYCMAKILSYNHYGKKIPENMFKGQK